MFISRLLLLLMVRNNPSQVTCSGLWKNRAYGNPCSYTLSKNMTTTSTQTLKLQLQISCFHLLLDGTGR